MENMQKKVPFKWEFGEETVSLHVDSYVHGKGLYIGMTNYGEDGPEPFTDMTVNIPGYSLEPNEAFISGNISKNLLEFIKENKLGKKQPYTVKSGYGNYAVVAFDLDKLKEFDPKGIEEFKKLHDIPEKSPVKKQQRNKGMER